MLDRIDHVNLVVEDLPRMMDFYRGLLGMRVIRQITIGGPWITTLTGLADVEADVVYLEPPSGPPVELIRYRTPEGSRPADLGAPNTPGLRHVAFRVADLEAAVAALRAAGTELLHRLDRPIRALHEAAMSGLSRSETTELIRLLDKVRDRSSEHR